MATSGGRSIFFLAATIFIADRKQADQPTANNCSGFVPLPGVPGTDNFTSSRPSELRDAPFSRPPVVWALAVYITLSSLVIIRSSHLQARRQKSESHAFTFKQLKGNGFREFLRHGPAVQVSTRRLPKSAVPEVSVCNRDSRRGAGHFSHRHHYRLRTGR